MGRPGLPEHLRHRIGGPAPVAPVLLQVALVSGWSSDNARFARLRMRRVDLFLGECVDIAQADRRAWL
jgi:hypothetical protein